MPAGTADLTFERGITFSASITLMNPNTTPFDLTGYTAKAQGRMPYDDASASWEASTDNGFITITPLTGVVDIVIPAATTATMGDWTDGVWDIVLTGASQVLRPLAGRFRVTGVVTQ